MKPAARHSLHIARSVEDALAVLIGHQPAAEVLAGATWIMRADLRGESEPRHYVSIAHLPALRGIDMSTTEIAIGACVTHAELARALGDVPGLEALAVAAARSANPAIRNVATIGGNISTPGFAAADLVPALLCLGASVDYADPEGGKRLDFAEFLARRSTLLGHAIVTRVIVPNRSRRSAHVRLPLRKAGDYPVAIVSVSAEVAEDGTIGDTAIAVGSVEAAARRWKGLEAALAGKPLDPPAIAETAKTRLADFAGRDGVEAPGWYRTQVLPALVRRAFENLAAG